MNDLFSFPRGSDMEASSIDIEMAVNNSEKSLVGFFEEVSAVKDSMASLQELLFTLNDDNEQSKAIHQSRGVKELRERMDVHVKQILSLAKKIKSQIEALEKGNEANRKVKGCEAGSSTDRTRVSITKSLGVKLKDLMTDFSNLRERMSQEYKETIERRYFTVTGEQASSEMIDRMIETGESENFLRKAIQEQGRGQIVETLHEIQERHDAVKQIETSLQELHQIFLDIAALVEFQGGQLDTIEASVNKASSFVENGRGQLERAKKSQRNSRKWTCIAIILLLIIILVIVLPLVLKK